MDWLTFHSEVVRSLAWPVTVLVILWMYRSELARLLVSLHSLKLGTWELKFKLEKATERLVEKVQADTGYSWSPDRIRTLVRRFPGALTRPERLIVVLHYLEGLSFHEIALNLGMAEAEVEHLHETIVERLIAEEAKEEEKDS
ncbi:MAG: sigma factor-like helix-turn-helix DNA-binding protein [Phycisphaeraceae bacterium]